MLLRIGDRLVSESGEWKMTGRPFTTAGGKTAHARVKKVNQPDVTEVPYVRAQMSFRNSDWTPFSPYPGV
jgi:hypothetical protein